MGRSRRAPQLVVVPPGEVAHPPVVHDEVAHDPVVQEEKVVHDAIVVKQQPSQQLFEVPQL
jgi:hypothetical protein